MYKTKEDIIEDIHCNICINNPVYIYQHDFDSGPYVISEPGLYILMQNIKTEFFKNKGMALSFNQKDKFGHAAALKITCDNVILDLNGYYIAQSPRDYCVQRFFAIIQLNSMPFNPNVGPIAGETRQHLDTANNCIIKNGILGLSAHQSILGNNNENIIIESVNCEDFEVSGITLNNVENVYIESCIIGQSLGGEYSNGNRRFVPITPFFAGLTFSHKVLSQVLDDVSITKTSEQETTLTDIIGKLNAILDPVLDVIFNHISLTSIYSSLIELCQSNPDICLLVNYTPGSEWNGLSPCNIHGVKITGKNPSIGAFHTTLSSNSTDTTSYSSGVSIHNVTIQNLIAKVDEEIILTYEDAIIHICAGLKATYGLIHTGIGKCLIKSVYSLISTNESIKTLLKSNITQQVVEFIEDPSNCTDIGFKRSFDIMGHINKGVMGVRLGSCMDVCLNNIKILNIKNIGSELTDEKIKEIVDMYECIDSIEKVDTTLISPTTYTGSYAVASILSGCVDVNVNGLHIDNIHSPDGCAVGLCVNNLCDGISFDNVDIGMLKSCDSCNDSTTILIDYKSKNIKNNNVCIH
jgi:hypothetical protein